MSTLTCGTFGSKYPALPPSDVCPEWLGEKVSRLFGADEERAVGGNVRLFHTRDIREGAKSVRYAGTRHTVTAGILMAPALSMRAMRETRTIGGS